MEQAALKILAFEKIQEQLADRAGSLLGKERALALTPTSDYEEAAARLTETAEAVSILALTVPPLGGIRDIRPFLTKVGLGAVLVTEELTEVRSTLYAMRNVK